ncbi:MAG: hypothetical protein A3G02_03060 [Candidatus Yanofskybacteria bacterium RIFCSPLOWO2_12_FULL_44_13b]|uniref:Uncharacterized protein n=2 Tax=Candidatus Yanofskyibacteriota TaxID=1752733 RepID=A0A1F8GZS1_9BACT|nr:MAG: hypothetical protein UW14_C0007G0017 [Candidatus Yanofskybacteria bacterium GW2011_GWA2_44_10]KKT90029.1 MAG: hypothetical protein UW90_C0008G0018 [Candidatus Yanofskybacteria bacterium GW2011_GWB1_45_11]OGN03808.1 MAG: hypothetical protein A2657_00200 [Candidatus Yanofskybacteria bacterium RIFCSPHIGHO2_01_FULL_44_110b]OGN14697.1 MAG: hypothetical protein A3C01_02030 [Candidatus Yanofskybacteria bacterium RIFCSPHIGHO2_02_FULL_44_36b]OGN18345.1 MAG: hypothetical protein A3F50_00370 [Cand
MKKSGILKFDGNKEKEDCGNNPEKRRSIDHVLPPTVEDIQILVADRTAFWSEGPYRLGYDLKHRFIPWSKGERGEENIRRESYPNWRDEDFGQLLRQLLESLEKINLRYEKRMLTLTKDSQEQLRSQIELLKESIVDL